MKNDINNNKRLYLPVNLNKGKQRYCFINAVGNALGISINRIEVDNLIMNLNGKTNENHGICSIGMLSVHGLNHCIQRLFPEWQLNRESQEFHSRGMIRYLRYHRPIAGIVYAWKSFPDSESSDAPWKTLSHAIAFRNSHFINDYDYKTDLIHNVSSIDEDDEHCLSRHFETKRKQYPYSYRFYRLVKVRGTAKKCRRLRKQKPLVLID
jgi:hypothetical protein